MAFTIPRLVQDQQNKYSILFYVDRKRYRISNGKRFGVDLDPNKLPRERRHRAAEELRLIISKALKEGWGQSVQPSLTLLAAIRTSDRSEAKETNSQITKPKNYDFYNNHF